VSRAGDLGVLDASSVLAVLAVLAVPSVLAVLNARVGSLTSVILATILAHLRQTASPPIYYYRKPVERGVGAANAPGIQDSQTTSRL
jgi:hypothetical protein